MQSKAHSDKCNHEIIDHLFLLIIIATEHRTVKI